MRELWRRSCRLALVGALAASALAAGPLAPRRARAAPRAGAQTGSARGGALDRPAAVAVAGNGDYFVADAGHNRVAHFSGIGTFLGSIGQPAGGPATPARSDLNAPAGVALDGKGNLFVADLGNGRVAEYNLAGAYIGQIGAYGFDAGKLLGPTAVAVGSDGRVYVLDTGGEKVNVFSATGRFITRWGSAGGGSGEFDGPSGLALDRTNNVYVADTNNSRVEEFAPTGSYIAQWGQFGTGVGTLRYPTAVAVDARGAIWVADSGNGRVVQIQHPQAFQGSFSLGILSHPGGVAVAGPMLYVVDTAGERIDSYDAGGTLRGTIGTGGHGAGQISRPLGVATASGGTIYVADTNNNRIVTFGPSGSHLATYGAQGRSNVGRSPRFLGPSAVAVDAAGNIYVADTFNSRIQKLDAGGSVQWAQRVGGQPRGIAVDGAGNVFVTSYFNQKVLKFDSSGRLVTEWGGRGTTNGLFDGPAAIAVDRAGRVYVADTGNKRVAVFSLLPDGTYGYTGQFGGAGTAQGQFSTLGGIALAANDVVYAVDGGGLRLETFNPFGARFTGWSGNGQLQSISAVALDSSGHVVVADSSGDRIGVYSATGAIVRQLP